MLETIHSTINRLSFICVFFHFFKHPHSTSLFIICASKNAQSKCKNAQQDITSGRVINEARITSTEGERRLVPKKLHVAAAVRGDDDWRRL